MAIRRSKEVLERLLAGGTLAAAELEELIAKCSDEDQFLDYKSGKQDPEKLKKTIRRWVTGFANAEGGVLIVGVTEPDKKEKKPRHIDGVTVPGEANPHDWATRVLQDLTGSFSPPPTILQVGHPEGAVLVVATARAPQLIPYVEAGDVKYALRIGESTVDVPSYLLADLILGRRNHPILQADGITLPQDPIVLGTQQFLQIKILFKVENLSFVTSRDTEIGVVSWSLFGGPVATNSNLLQHLDTEKPLTAFEGSSRLFWYVLRSPAKSGATIKPFDFLFTDCFVANVPRSPGNGTIHFALYLLPDGSMPTWYEVSCQYALTISGNDARILGTPKLERIFGTRPRLRWWS
jgi:hypothetical protein